MRGYCFGKTLAMTRSIRFDGTLHVVMVHCILSLCIALCHNYLILPLRAKQSDLSLVNKQYLLIKGVMGVVKNLQKKDIFTQQRNREYLSH
jgi:hypothetical protein